MSNINGVKFIKKIFRKNVVHHKKSNKRGIDVSQFIPVALLTTDKSRLIRKKYSKLKVGINECITCYPNIKGSAPMIIVLIF